MDSYFHLLNSGIRIRRRRQVRRACSPNPVGTPGLRYCGPELTWEIVVRKSEKGESFVTTAHDSARVFCTPAKAAGQEVIRKGPCRACLSGRGRGIVELDITLNLSTATKSSTGSHQGRQSAHEVGWTTGPKKKGTCRQSSSTRAAGCGGE